MNQREMKSECEDRDGNYTEQLEQERKRNVKRQLRLLQHTHTLSVDDQSVAAAPDDGGMPRAKPCHAGKRRSRGHPPSMAESSPCLPSPFSALPLVFCIGDEVKKRMKNEASDRSIDTDNNYMLYKALLPPSRFCGHWVSYYVLLPPQTPNATLFPLYISAKKRHPLDFRLK